MPLWQGQAVWTPDCQVYSTSSYCAAVAGWMGGWADGQCTAPGFFAWLPPLVSAFAVEVDLLYLLPDYC